MGLAPKTVDLVARAEEAVEELRSRAEDQGIHLQLRTEDSAVSAEANGGGVQIVMRNLLPSAIRHTGDGGHVWIRVRREAERAVLEIADTGIGVEPEIAGTLFEPFRQASEGMAREYEGTGLGLAVTQETVDRVDGSIEVETAKGKGSRFVIRLPRPSAAPSP